MSARNLTPEQLERVKPHFDAIVDFISEASTDEYDAMVGVGTFASTVVQGVLIKRMISELDRGNVSPERSMEMITQVAGMLSGDKSVMLGIMRRAKETAQAKRGERQEDQRQPATSEVKYV